MSLSARELCGNSSSTRRRYLLRRTTSLVVTLVDLPGGHCVPYLLASDGLNERLTTMPLEVPLAVQMKASFVGSLPHLAFTSLFYECSVPISASCPWTSGVASVSALSAAWLPPGPRTGRVVVVAKAI